MWPPQQQQQPQQSPWADAPPRMRSVGGMSVLDPGPIEPFGSIDSSRLQCLCARRDVCRRVCEHVRMMIVRNEEVREGLRPYRPLVIS